MSKKRRTSAKASVKRKVKKAVKKAVRKAKPKARRKIASKHRPAKRKKSVITRKIKVTIPKTAASAIHQASNSALKLVDQAATLLRSGIRTSANQTEKARHESRKHVLSLVNRAANQLNRAVDKGSSGLRSIIGRL